VLTLAQWSTLAIVTLSLIGIALGRLPTVKLNRASIAFVGASLLIALNIESVASAWQRIDGDIIVLLLSLMIVNTVLTHARFFQLMTYLTVRGVKTTFGLMSSLVIVTGVLSAFFFNDIIVIMLTQMVISVTQALKRDPVPYLLALVMSANIGSVATLTGNPQNLIVGLRSGISFLEFLLALAPVAAIGLGLLIFVLVVSYPREFIRVPLTPPTLEPPNASPRLLIRTLTITGLMLVAFMTGYSVTAAAMIAASAMLLLGRSPSDNVLRDIDWNVLIVFAGLFIVVGSLDSVQLTPLIAAAIDPLLERNDLLLGGLTLILSNLLSNVPTVLVLSPIVEPLESTRAWLTLAVASTLAGNFTVLGSVANLILIELARKLGVTISFMSYLRVGVPVTLLTLLIGIIYLQLTL
jgi:Na+/H+ antiporter NhaD/arsenite permease-like protein